MMDERKELISRAEDLAQKSLDLSIYTRTAFLTEGERAALATAPLPLRPSFVGGYEEAERTVALFGSEEDLSYPWESDLVLLKIEPVSQKFADALTHRDFLGAMMNLGIKRELLGDLLIHENVGYQFVLEPMAEYLSENLETVRHTKVKICRMDALPEGCGVSLEEKEVISPSARLDALLSAVWNLSRGEGKKLVESERVSIGGAIVTNPSREVKSGERVSVRGYGRFYFDGEDKKTRSGKGRMKVRVFR